jgi:ABC-type lipopolysaccharide export system ATPase subunit
LGLVSFDIPLISNLEVWLNIALVKQYHQNINNSEARDLVLQYLHRFNLSGIADKRNPALTHKERFYTMLLRAIMVADAFVVIDRPFLILPYLSNADFIVDALTIVSDSYVESHIFDYSSNGHRYRTNNAETN